MAGRKTPGLGCWKLSQGKGKGMKNRRKHKRHMAQLAAIRKRMEVERAKRAEEMGQDYDQYQY